MSSLFMSLMLSYALLILQGCGGLPKEHKLVKASDGDIRIPVSEVSDGKVHFFTYKKSGKKTNFFVRTDGKGALTVYFDACLTCHKHKKGYRQEGADIVCNECNMRFRLADEKWDNKDGCSPIFIKTSEVDGFIVISADHLEKGGRLF